MATEFYCELHGCGFSEFCGECVAAWKQAQTSVPAPPTRTEEPENGWQPIDTAPKSGEWVWMRSEKTGRVSAFRWDSSQDATGNHWFAGTGWWPQVDRMFTHWKPMVSQPDGPSENAIQRDVHADAQMLLDALAGPTAELRRLREQIETMRTKMQFRYDLSRKHYDSIKDLLPAATHGHVVAITEMTYFAAVLAEFNESFPPERP